MSIKNSKAVATRASCVAASTQLQSDCGVETTTEVEQKLYVMSELHLPEPGASTQGLTHADHAHPFWLIRRIEKDDEVGIMELVYDDCTEVVVSRGRWSP